MDREIATREEAIRIVFDSLMKRFLKGNNEKVTITQKDGKITVSQGKI